MDGNPRSDSDDNVSQGHANNCRSEDDESKTRPNDGLSEYLLENQSVAFLRSLPHKIEQWVDEIQETAMVDVPIFIFFCTQSKPQTLIERIICDRDNLTPVDLQEKSDEIECLIETTKSSFAAYRNIHVFSGSTDVDLDKLLGGHSGPRPHDEIAFDVVEPLGSQDGALGPGHNAADFGELTDVLQNKYVLNIEDVIMELSEEQLSSVMGDSPRGESESILQ